MLKQHRADTDLTTHLMAKPPWQPDTTELNPPTLRLWAVRGRGGWKWRTGGEEEEWTSTCHMLTVTAEQSLEAQTDWPPQTCQPARRKYKTSIFLLTAPNCALTNHADENAVKILQLKRSMSNCMTIFQSTWQKTYLTINDVLIKPWLMHAHMKIIAGLTKRDDKQDKHLSWESIEIV